MDYPILITTDVAGGPATPICKLGSGDSQFNSTVNGTWIEPTKLYCWFKNLFFANPSVVSISINNGADWSIANSALKVSTLAEPSVTSAVPATYTVTQPKGSTNITISATSCRELMPDLDRFIENIYESADELEQALLTIDPKELKKKQRENS